MAGLPICATDEQLAVCGEQMLGEGAQCPLAGDPLAGICQSGICIRSRCGDGLRVGLEQCDGSVTEAESHCTFHGFYEDGTVTCGPDCKFDTTSCGAICGDNQLDSRETCDPADLSEVVADCTDVGFYKAGPVTCNAACQYNIASCSERCGDGVVNGPEICDSAPPAGLSCTTAGFDAGQLTCASGCYDDRGLCRSIGFSPEVPLGSMYINDIWGSGEDFYSVGTDDHLLHSSGGSWARVAGGFPVLNGVWGASKSNVYVAGGASVGWGLFHYDGTAWTKVTVTNPGTVTTLNDVHGSGPSDIWAVGDNTAVLRYDGTSWTKLTTGLPSGLSLKAVWAATPSNVWIAGITTSGSPTPGLYRWNGTSWDNQTIASTYITHLIGRSATEVYALDATARVVYRYNGTSWSSIGGCKYNGASVMIEALGGMPGGPIVASGVDSTNQTAGRACWVGGNKLLGMDLGSVEQQSLTAVGGSERRLYIGGHDFLLRSDGAAWVEVPAPPAPNTQHALWGSSMSNLFVAGDKNGAISILHFDGTTWSEVGPAGVGDFTAMSGGTGWIVATARGGEVLDSTAGAAGTWSISGINSEDLEDVWGDAAGTNIYVVGDAFAQNSHPGFIAKRVGPGNWSQQTSGTDENLKAVWGAGTSVFVVGDGGTILRNVGTDAWTPMTSGTTKPLRDVWGRSETDVFAVGDVALHFDGTSWSRIPTSQPLTRIWGAGGEVFAGAGQRLFHYAGGRFLPLTSPVANFDLTHLWGLADVTVFLSAASIRAFAGTLSFRYEASETRCANGWDDDGNGAIDCADSACAAAPACAAPGVCEPIIDVACGQTLDGTTVGGATWWPAYGAGCDPMDESGPEAYYRVKRPSDGSITVRISGLVTDLDLIAAGTTGGACTPDRTCLAASQHIGNTNEMMSITATANQDYIVIVDGEDGNAGAFTLDVTCP